MALISNERLDELLAASPSPDRLTSHYLTTRIASVDYSRPTGTMTIAVITTVNGFTVTGESACADPANYNEEIGQKVAYDMAFGKLWPLEGYLLKEKLSLREPAE